MSATKTSLIGKLTLLLTALGSLIATSVNAKQEIADQQANIDDLTEQLKEAHRNAGEGLSDADADELDDQIGNLVDLASNATAGAAAPAPVAPVVPAPAAAEVAAPAGSDSAPAPSTVDPSQSQQ